MTKRASIPAIASAVCLVALSCADLAAPATGPSDARRSLTSSATLTGRIVYTLSGRLRVYDVATKVDVGLGVDGVNPKFSPDGALIVYQSNGLRVMNADGSGSRLLHSAGGTPSFDPTSTRIAFGDNGIWQINVDGAGLTKLSGAGLKPAWSPDGSQISYQATADGRQQLFVMNADGTNQRRVLTSEAIIDPVWLPSSKIVFGMLAARGNYDIYSYDPAVSSSLTRLTARKGNDFEPSWSPDGNGIAWASTTSPAGIWIMNADGSAQQGPVIAKGRQGSWGR